jgi:hypothetical protein
MQHIIAQVQEIIKGGMAEFIWPFYQGIKVWAMICCI